MIEPYTAGALRLLDFAARRARLRGAPAASPADLLAALADEPESRAASLLAENGLPLDRLGNPLEPVEGDEGPPADPEAAPHDPALRSILAAAAVRARGPNRAGSVGTEHLLGALLAERSPGVEALEAAGLDAVGLLASLEEPTALAAATIELGDDLPPPELADPHQVADLARVLDASANRAGEGLRVVEDYARFALDDPGLTRRLKDVRHRLAAAVRALDLDLRLTARDATGDVGSHVMAPPESARADARAVLAANFRRAAEALRSLEEYAKVVDDWLAGRFEVLRYDVYTLEKLVLAAVAARRSIGEARLYLLVGGLPTLGDLTWVVGEALAGGVQAVQYRDKGLPDRVVLERARELRLMTAKARARLFVNDRPDLARLAGADGVHLGQEDLAVRDARRVVGPNAAIGVSTHDPAQLDAAILAGANYLGVGPVFPSTTKDFAPETLAGLALVGRAAEATSLPWFAIGGIAPDNLDAVLAAGATRVAVGAAIVRAPSPREAAAALRSRLDAVS